jgi:polysaccharide pyruvyl transferase WcaK-like protein
VEKLDCDIALISMEHMDLPPSQEIYNAMKHKDRARIVSSDEYDVDDIITVLSSLKFLVTTRYHACVLSSCSAIPTIAVSSDTRCETVFRELDMMDFFIDYVKHPDQTPKVEDIYKLLTGMTDQLLKREDELKDKIRKAHPVFVERASRNRRLFKEWLDGTFSLKG